MKQRFEFQEGKSSKFWEIELHGSSITTTWGRIGTAGQSKTKDFDSDAKAEKEYNKLIAEKAGKGYTEVNVFSEDADNLEQAGRESSPEVDSNKDDSFPVLLNCIREWLQKTEPQYHNCPELKTSSEDYAELVRQVDAKLPEQFFQLYNVFGGLALSYGFCDCNDGQKNDEEREPDDLFGGAYFMPLAGVDGVVFEHERFEDQDFEDEPAQGPVKRMCYNKQWIPFAKDYGGNFVGIDLDPAKHGKYGQVIKFGRDEVPTVLAQDLQTFFGNYCKNHGISLPDAISQALLQAKTNVAQNTERKKNKR